MVADHSIDFQAYLQSLCDNDIYRDLQEFYTPTDALDRQRSELKKSRLSLDLGLMVQTIQPPQPEGEAPEREKIERLNVLEGLRNYAANHVLLVGRPGSGKSTALERLLWEEAQKCRGEGENLTTIPVLVELGQYETSVLDLIREFLRRHQLPLDEARIETLLFEGRFLLLVDGVNQLPNEARRNLEIFRQNNPNTPMIFTTRYLGMGGNLGIEKKLEMQPLTPEQMQQFVRAYLPEEGEEMLRRLGEKLRDFAQTPLLLWMLCELFRQTGDIPPNLGLVFRCFAQSYNTKFWDSVRVSDELRHLLPELLQHLAFTMMQGKSPTELQVSIRRQEAEAILTKFLEGKIDYPPSRAKSWLEDLLKHHLIQLASNDQIEFRHQLLQEYYAAECLLQQLTNTNNDKLKRNYLNYLKWTEPLALMLALVDEAQAVRVVKLALNVDWWLGARLAGEVKPQFQEQTVGLVNGLKIAYKLKIQLLGITRSASGIPVLCEALKDQNSDIRKKVTEALGSINCEAAILALHQALNDENLNVRRSAAIILGKIGNEAAIFVLQEALEDKIFSDYFWVVYALKQISDETAVNAIRQVLKHTDPDVRKKAIEALWHININNEIAVPTLIECLKDADYNVRYSAAFGLGQIGNKTAVPALIQALMDENWSVRHTICFALNKIGNDAAVLYISQQMWDKESALAIKVAEPSLQISSIKIFQDKNSNLRALAVELLGLLGNETAIPTLIYALYDESIQVHSYASIALGRIGSKAAIYALVQALGHWYFGVRSIAAYVLGEFTSQIVISALTIALEDENLNVRESVTAALNKIHNKQDEAVDTQSDTANSSEDIDIETIILELRQALQNQDFIACGNAIEAIEKLGDGNGIPELIKALESEYTSIRWLASSAIGKLGRLELLPYFSELLIITEDEPLRAAIFGIQERYKLYNYAIATSPPPEEDKQSDPLIDTLNKLNQRIEIMSETPKIQMNFNAPITGSSVAGNVEGDSIGIQNNNPTTQAIAEVEKLLQQLLEQIEQTKPTPTEAQVIVAQAVEKHPVLKNRQIIEQAIKRYPPLTVRLQRVVTAVGIETVKVLFAPAGIAIEAIRAWNQSE